MSYPQYPQQPQTPGYQQFPGYPHQPPLQYPYGAQQPVAVAPPPPPNHLALAIVGLIFCWPIGLPAVLNATKVDTMYASGQWQAAYVFADRAKRCGIWAIAVGCVVSVLYVVLSIVAETL